MAILERVFDLAFAALVLSSALGVGRVVLRRVGLLLGSTVEQDVFALGIGLGVMTQLLVALGLLRLLYAPLLIALLVVLAGVVSREVRIAVGQWRARWLVRTPLSRLERGLVAGMALLALPVGIRALTPPTAYDALMYHLVAPKAFLGAHALTPLFENISANSPLALDLLAVLGFSAGSEVLLQLVQFALVVVLAASIFEFAACRFGRMTGILAAAIFTSIPLVGVLAGWAYLDMGWILYEWLGVYAFWNWVERRRGEWLLVGAVALGLALSNKYLALQGASILTLAVGVASWGNGWKSAVRNSVVLSAVAALVAAPWYLKNWVWLGNPVYPYFLGGANYDALRQQLNSYYVSAYGLGRDAMSYFLLPWNIFAQPVEFGGESIGSPSYCFWLLPFYLALPKSRVVNVLLVLSGLRFGWWAIGAQELRYLLVVYPLLSIASAYVVSQALARWTKPFVRAEVGLLLLVILGTGLLVQWQYLWRQREALAFLSGAMSRAEFLRASLNPYAATEFVNRVLPAEAKILAIGDGRGYYFEREFISDTGRDQWARRLARARTFEAVALGFRQDGITHIWVSAEDLEHIYTRLDRAGRVREEMRAFDQFKQRHLVLVYRDERGFELYALPGETKLVSRGAWRE